MYRLAVSLLVVAFMSPLNAQEFRGSISGRVSDPSGAVIGGATITAVNVRTNVSTNASSTATGNYQLQFLLPGSYIVSVDMAGFKRLERKNIEVNADTRTSLDLSLELGATSDSVTVSADTPMLDTSSAELGRTVTAEFVARMDFSMNRNVTAMAHLSPGITGNAGGTYSAPTSNAISINGGGGRRGANEYMIDGIPNIMANAVVNYTPTTDATEEFRVYSTMFDASLGHSNGGAISIVTKGGGNDPHGTAYAYRRMTWMNAAGWTNNRNGQPKPNSDYYQYGYLLTGPVYIPKLYNGRNRTFFSHSFERDRDNRPLSQVSRVPTSLERQGDFSQTLNRSGGALSIYDPLSTVVNGTTATRSLFPGARIPASRQDPTGVTVMSFYPQPNLNAPIQIATDNWAASNTYAVRQFNFMGRLDHNISDRQRLFFRFAEVGHDADIAREYFHGVLCGNCLHENLQFTNVGLDDTYTISPTVVANLRLGMGRNSINQARGGFGLDPAEIKLPDAIIRNQFKPAFPTLAIGDGIMTFGSQHPQSQLNMLTVFGGFTKMQGSHSIKSGLDVRVNRSNLSDPGAAGFGTFTFNTRFTQANPFLALNGATGSGMAAFLLGLPTSGSLGYISPVSLQNFYQAAYVNDDWRVSKRLTLTFGLRWENETPYTERYNRVAYGFDTSAPWSSSPAGLNLRGGIRFAGVDGNPRTAGNSDAWNFGPRFGLAYTLFKHTVLRGGYGIFYGSMAENDKTFWGQVGSFDANTPFVGSIDSGATPFATLRNPFPTGMQPILGSAAGVTAQAGSGITGYALNRLMPYTQQWQFSIQQLLPARTTAELSYIGSHSLKLGENFELNELSDVYRVLGDAQKNSLTSPFLNVLPATSTLGQGATVTQRQMWLRYPQFTSVTLEAVPTGRASYNALQYKLDKRVSNGLTLIVSYTYSKIMTSNIDSLVNERHYRSVGAYDQKHFLRTAWVYQVPFRWKGSTGKRLLDLVAGGWEVSGHYTWNTGIPLAIDDANGRPYRIAPVALDGDIKQRLGDRRSGTTVVNPYFNTNAFVSLPSVYSITPEPPQMDELRAPSVKLMNLQIGKGFRVSERFNLVYNVEAENALNAVNFNSPGLNLNNKGTFGVIQSAGSGRLMMMSLRLRF